MKMNKYIIMQENNNSLLPVNNVIYQGYKATKIPQLAKIKKLIPEAKVYKLTEIKL